MNGLQTRVRTSNVILEQRLRLTFVALTEAQMLNVRSHYVGQQGRFLSFDIPTSLLSGMTTPASFTPTGYSWIYDGAPQVEDIPGIQRYTVSVELITVPPEGANINGADFTVFTTLVGGAPTTGASLTGFDLTVTVSLEAGEVGGDVEIGGASAPGMDTIVSISLLAGSASGSSGTASEDYFGLLMLIEDDLFTLTD